MSKIQILLDGTAVDAAFYDTLTSVEVEENADLPAAIRLKLPVTTKDKDLTWVNDGRLKPFTNICVVITPEEGEKECIFDGYVLAHKIHLESGITASTLEVTGQDATVLMALEEKTREFSDLTARPGRQRGVPGVRLRAGRGQHRRRLPVGDRGHAHPDAARVGRRLPRPARQTHRAVVPRRVRRHRGRSNGVLPRPGPQGRARDRARPQHAGEESGQGARLRLGRRPAHQRDRKGRKLFRHRSRSRPTPPMAGCRRSTRATSGRSPAATAR